MWKQWENSFGRRRQNKATFIKGSLRNFVNVKISASGARCLCLSHFDSYLLFLHSFYTFLHNAALNTCWRPTESKFLNQNVDIEQLRVAFPWPAASEPTITPQIIILSVTRVIFFFFTAEQVLLMFKVHFADNPSALSNSQFRLQRPLNLYYSGTRDLICQPAAAPDFITYRFWQLLRQCDVISPKKSRTHTIWVRIFILLSMYRIQEIKRSWWANVTSMSTSDLMRSNQIRRRKCNTILKHDQDINRTDETGRNLVLRNIFQFFFFTANKHEFCFYSINLFCTF